MDELLGQDKGMDKSHDIIDKEGLRSMYQNGWIIDKYAWFMDKYAFSSIGEFISSNSINDRIIDGL